MPAKIHIFETFEDAKLALADQIWGESPITKEELEKKQKKVSDAWDKKRKDLETKIGEAEQGLKTLKQIAEIRFKEKEIAELKNEKDKVIPEKSYQDLDYLQAQYKLLDNHKAGKSEGLKIDKIEAGDIIFIQEFDTVSDIEETIKGDQSDLIYKNIQRSTLAFIQLDQTGAPAQPFKLVMGEKIRADDESFQQDLDLIKLTQIDEREIKKLYLKYYPYRPYSIILDVDDRTLSLSPNDIFSGHTEKANAPIHPYLKDYKNNPVAILYKLQTIADGNITSISLRKIETNPGVDEKSQRVFKTIDDLLQAFHFVNARDYITIDKFVTEAKEIIKRFTNSEALTESKKNILSSFIGFYKNHAHDPDFMPRSVMVQKWIEQYKKENDDKNPFVQLNQHRRTDFLRFFNRFITTDSTKLFEKFLAGEKIPEELQKTMQQKEQPKGDRLTIE